MFSAVQCLGSRQGRGQEKGTTMGYARYIGLEIRSLEDELPLALPFTMVAASPIRAE